MTESNRSENGRVFLGGEWLSIPSAPAKYDKFLRARASILREINNMLQLSEHPNILRLHEVNWGVGGFVEAFTSTVLCAVKALLPTSKRVFRGVLFCKSTCRFYINSRAVLF